MARIIPLLTLIPSIFTFIAIIFINVGGVGRPFSGGFSNPRNTNLDLISWNYTVSPSSGTFYTVSIFLNRQCRGGQAFLSAQRGQPAGQQCPQRATRTVSDRSSVLAPNILLSSLRPFRFSQVNLAAPFILYITAAIFVVLAIVTALGIALSGKSTRGPRVLGSTFSVVSFIFVLIASAVITWQTLRLGNQVRNDTLETVARRNTTFGASFDDLIPYTIEIQDVSIGRPVQGLTWAAVVAMFIAAVMWVFAAIKSPENNAPPPVYKEERNSTSPSDRYVQSGV